MRFTSKKFELDIESSDSSVSWNSSKSSKSESKKEKNIIRISSPNLPAVRIKKEIPTSTIGGNFIQRKEKKEDTFVDKKADWIIQMQREIIKDNQIEAKDDFEVFNSEIDFSNKEESQKALSIGKIKFEGNDDQNRRINLLLGLDCLELPGKAKNSKTTFLTPTLRKEKLKLSSEKNRNKLGSVNGLNESANSDIDSLKSVMRAAGLKSIFSGLGRNNSTGPGNLKKKMEY